MISKSSRYSKQSEDSSLENFEQVMERHRDGAALGMLGLTTESDNEKHLIVSNIKSSASRTNTTKQSLDPVKRRAAHHNRSVEDHDQYKYSESSDDNGLTHSLSSDEEHKNHMNKGT